MKKSIIALFAAASMVAGVNAQDQAGEDSAFGIGSLGGYEIATAAVVLGVGAAVISNNRGSSKNPTPPTELTCNEGDVLVDDVCVGTTNTVTVSASQTVTQTITVPVTFTYAPFVQ